MGTISTGIGLISGLDIQSLVTQLMAIESRPLQLLQARIEKTTQQRMAYTLLSARLMAAQSAISSLAKPAAFTAKSAASSNESVLSAAATSATPTGSYSFTVRSLVSTHQLVSRGFRDRDSAPVGAGRLTFEIGQGDVAPSTSLNGLNGGDGVRRGVIRITDRNGDTADVDLTAALTVDDVLDAINSQSGANVRASVRANAIVITDLSGGTASDLRVMDVAGGFAAADLGIAGVSATGAIEGGDIVSLTESTRLSRLNDGIGVRFNNTETDLLFNLANGSSFEVNLSEIPTFDTHLGQLNDGHGVRLGTIRITNRNGDSAEVDLSGAETIADVKDAIDSAGIGVTLSAIAGAKLVVGDSSGGTSSNLKIEDVTGYAAADLGIVADTEDDSFSGLVIYRMDTLGAVMAAIEYAEGNDGNLSVALSDNGIVLTDNTTGAWPSEVVAQNDSLAARDLGLQGAFDGSGQLTSRDLLAGLNTVLLSSLNGGNGLTTGTVTFSRRDGSTFDLDFSGAQTLSDVIAVINDDGRLSAEVDAGSTRIRIIDPTEGAATFSATGAMADALGLTALGLDELVSDDLQLQYIAENTLLADLNLGRGVANGSFTITARDGTTGTVTLREGSHESVGDVIDAINALQIGVVARINAHGDGIELEDTTTGSGTLTVAQDGNGTTAADLGILGSADETGVLTGSFASEIEIGAADTLDELVAKINEAGVGLTASVINDGTGDNPYRLVLSSGTTGRLGKIAFSGDIPGLSLETLSDASDATIVVGDPSSPNAIVVTSSSNTVTDVVPGLTLNLLGTSQDPVEVTVGRDVETLVTDVKTFVKTFNDTLDSIDELTQYIPETEARGILLGDSTVRRIEDRLYQAVSAFVNDGDAALKSFMDVGLRVSSASLENPGPRLRLDEEKFREAFENDPEAVKALFARVTTDDEDNVVKVGLAARLDDVIETLTTTAGGLLNIQDQRLQSKIDLYNERADDLQKLLDLKEARLYAQFQAMELALASLQAQQSSLAVLANLAASSYSSSGGLSLG